MDMNETKLDQLLHEETVPPMPADVHDRWVAAIAHEPQQKVRTPLRTVALRTLATAAAAVFVLAGAITAGNSLMEKDAAPMAAGGTALANNKMMLSRSTSNYDAGDYVEYEDGMVYGLSMAAEPAEMEMAAEEERKIIRNVSLTIVTQQYDDSLSGLKAACTESGGWIASTNEYDESATRRAYLTLRIPAEKLDGFLASAGNTGRVTRRDETVEDATEGYYDTKSRLETQQNLLNRLTELVDIAEDLDDVLALESQMAQTQYEIERLQASLNRVDRKVDYATVDITLREEKPEEIVVNPELTLGERLQSALTTGVEALGNFLQSIAVYAVCALPFLAVVVLAWVVWKLLRRKVRK